MNRPTTHFAPVAALLLLTVVGFPACSKQSQVTPEEADTAALSLLAAKFASTSNRPSDQMHFIESVSLAKYMHAHQNLLNQWDVYGPEDALDRAITFSSGIAHSLNKTTPEEYFMSFTEKNPFLPNLREARTAAISIENDRAYIVYEIPPAKDSGRIRPDYLVQPAARTDSGWKMDVSSTHVRFCAAMSSIYD